MSQPRGGDEGNHAPRGDGGRAPRGDGGPHGGGPHGGGAPDLPPLPAGWAAIVIPDDPRDLAADAAIVRAELARDPAWPPRRAAQRLTAAGPLAALALMLTVAVTSLVMIVHPVGRTPPQAAPLARVTASPGTAGGLLPELHLWDTGDQPVDVRTLRPAVLLLVPADCQCAAAVEAVVGASRATLVQVALVGVDTRPAVPSATYGVQARSLLDPGGALFSAIGSPQQGAPRESPTVTAVLVRSDGVIARILRAPAATGEFENDLAGLTIP